MSHISAHLIPVIAVLRRFISCAVLLYHRGFAACTCGSHCSSPSQCHPRDNHETALELAMKLKAWTNNRVIKVMLHHLAAWMIKACWFKEFTLIWLGRITFYFYISYFWHVLASSSSSTGSNSVWKTSFLMWKLFSNTLSAIKPDIYAVYNRVHLYKCLLLATAF